MVALGSFLFCFGGRVEGSVSLTVRHCGIW